MFLFFLNIVNVEILKAFPYTDIHIKSDFYQILQNIEIMLVLSVDFWVLSLIYQTNFLSKESYLRPIKRGTKQNGINTHKETI
jgi:hypothetical protein